MAKYLGQGTMIPGAIEEDMVESQWKTWSIGCDVHLKTVCVSGADIKRTSHITP